MPFRSIYMDISLFSIPVIALIGIIAIVVLVIAANTTV